MLGASGLAVVAGSFGSWNACPTDPCGDGGGLTVILERSGVQFGLGIVSAILGTAIVLAAVWAASRPGRSRASAVRRAAAVGAVAAAGTMIVLAVHLIVEYVVRNEVLAPLYPGFFVAAAGAGLGLGSAIALRRAGGRETVPADRDGLARGP